MRYFDDLFHPTRTAALISVVANPKGGNQAPSFGIRGRQHKTQKWPKTEREGDLELNLGCCEPEGGESSALYRNPGSTT